MHAFYHALFYLASLVASQVQYKNSPVPCYWSGLPFICRLIGDVCSVQGTMN